MHLKWILLISSCLILSASSARRSSGSGGISRGATSFTRPSTSSRFLGSPRFSSSPTFSGRVPRPSTRTLHVHRAASAPPLSSLPPIPNSYHVPRAASAPPLPPRRPHSHPSTDGPRIPQPPPLPGFANTPKTGHSIPKPPPLPPNSFNAGPHKKSESGIPPLPPPPPKSNLPEGNNVPKSRIGLAAITPIGANPIRRIPSRRNTTTSGNVPKTVNYPGGNTTAHNVPKSATGSAVITPIGVRPVMTIPSRRNTTTGGNSTNTQYSNRNSEPANYPGRNTTVQTNLSKLPPLKPLQAGKNSTQGFKTSVNLAKGNAFNTTIRGSPKNTTNNFGIIGNASSRNATGNAKLNGTVNGVPQFSSGNMTRRNFTLSSNGINVLNSSRLSNHTRHNNTRNATGLAFAAGSTPISQTQPSPIGKFPWETLKPGNPQQSATNNLSPWDNSAQKYDVNNGDAPRKPRSDVLGSLTKTIIKSVAAKQNNGARSANLDNGLNGPSWDANRNEYAWKSSLTSKPPSPPSKIMKNQIILITVLISLVLIAAGVIVYFCNRK